jgi:hypothetical protein
MSILDVREYNYDLNTISDIATLAMEYLDWRGVMVCPDATGGWYVTTNARIYQIIEGLPEYHATVKDAYKAAFKWAESLRKIIVSPCD